MTAAKFQNTIESPWLELTPIRVGKVPSGLGTPDNYVVVQTNDEAILRIDVYGYAGEESFLFEKVIIWNEQVIIGFGHRVYFISLYGGMTKTINLGSHFYDFYVLPNGSLLIASGERLFCIGSNGNTNWSSVRLGFAIEIRNITDDFIYGQGELALGDEWHPFKVRIDSGKADDG